MVLSIQQVSSLSPSWRLRYTNFHCESPRGLCNTPFVHLLKTFDQKTSSSPTKGTSHWDMQCRRHARVLSFRFLFLSPRNGVYLHCHKRGVLWIWSTRTDPNKPLNESVMSHGTEAASHPKSEAHGLWGDSRRPERAPHKCSALASFVKCLRNDTQPCNPSHPRHTDAHPLLACEAACLERGLKPKPQNPTFLLRAVCVHTLALWPSFLSEQGFSRLWLRSPGLRCSSAMSQPRDFSIYPLGGSVSLSVKWS